MRIIKYSFDFVITFDGIHSIFIKRLVIQLILFCMQQLKELLFRQNINELLESARN